MKVSEGRSYSSLSLSFFHVLTGSVKGLEAEEGNEKEMKDTRDRKDTPSFSLDLPSSREDGQPPLWTREKREGNHVHSLRSLVLSLLSLSAVVNSQLTISSTITKRREKKSLYHVQMLVNEEGMNEGTAFEGRVTHPSFLCLIC